MVFGNVFEKAIKKDFKEVIFINLYIRVDIMPSYWKHVNKVLEEADLIIEVLDARLVEDTRNIEVEDKIKMKKKKILYVVNKCDLVKMLDLKEIKHNLRPSVFISSKDKLGTTILKKKILEMSKGNKVVV